MDNEGKTVVQCKHTGNCKTMNHKLNCKVFNKGGAYITLTGTCNFIKVDWITLLIFRKHFKILEWE
jgi:hypothetical protein